MEVGNMMEFQISEPSNGYCGSCDFSRVRWCVIFLSLLQNFSINLLQSTYLLLLDHRIEQLLYVSKLPNVGSRQMAQQLRALAVLEKDPCSFLSTHMMAHSYYQVQTHMQTYQQNAHTQKIIKEKIKNMKYSLEVGVNENRG